MDGGFFALQTGKWHLRSEPPTYGVQGTNRADNQFAALNRPLQSVPRLYLELAKQFRRNGHRYRFVNCRGDGPHAGKDGRNSNPGSN